MAGIAVTSIVAYASPANAQAYNYGNPGVANVSVANGGVVIVRGDSGTQVAATVNSPLLPGDYIATAPGSNAEVQFDGISMLRLASNTQVRFVNLNPNSREVQLASGTAELAELQGSDGSPQIDTPSLSVRPNQSGDCRVTVRGNGTTLVTVRSGAVNVSSANGSQTLRPGSTLVAYGSSIQMRNAIGLDAFDQFNISRDQAIGTAYNSNPYLSPQLAGYSNFANYGQWQNVPGYGYAWAPNNQGQSDFAPYQNGQWTWEPGYGYTWVDSAPYGYATSHYGTWFNNANYGGWLWQPPASQYQNSSASLASSWLPAVVSFFLSGNGGGFGGGLGGILSGLSGGFGNASNANIGWIPLAPGEQYQPWYGQNYSYPSTGLANVTNINNVYNEYSNARYYRGATMVPISAWRNGNFKHLVALRPQQLKHIALIRGAVPVVPTTANLHYASALRVSHAIVLSRTFAAPRLAAKAPRVTHSFTAQQAHIRSIVSARSKVVSLPARPVRPAHPVYHPVMHAPIHLTTLKPVTKPIARPAPITRTATHRTSVAKPGTRPAAPVAKPVTHAAPAVKPVTRPAPTVLKPVARPLPPAARPATVRAAPVHKPITRPAPTVVKPVTRAAAPLATPAMHRVPIVTPITHAIAPTARPAPVRATPVARPAPVHATPITKPAVQPVPVAKPVAKPVAHPAAQPGPKRSPGAG